MMAHWEGESLVDELSKIGEDAENRPESIGLASYTRLLRRNRNFRLLWGAQIVSELGDWFYTLALYSLLLDLTGKASSVALALVLQVLPQTFISPRNRAQLFAHVTFEPR